MIETFHVKPVSLSAVIIAHSAMMPTAIAPSAVFPSVEPPETGPISPTPYQQRLGQGSAEDLYRLVEYSARTSYQTWHRPRAATANVHRYVQHLIISGQEHYLDHASVTVHIEGISRATSQEILRNTHVHTSELSPRYIDTTVYEIAIPTALESHKDRVMQISRESFAQYREFITAVTEDNDPLEKEKRHALVQALPRWSATQIVVTGTIRGWRQFLLHVGNERVDTDHRQVALAVMRELSSFVPTFFYDFSLITTNTDKQYIVKNLT